jgi:predicted PurR-regulated permease PerM
MNKYPLAVRYLIWLLLIFSVITALVFTKTLLVPLFWAILLAYMLYPMAHKLEKAGLPRILTNLLLIIGAIVVIVGIGFLIGFLVSNFSSNLPDLKQNLTQNVSQIGDFLQRTMGISSQKLQDMVKKGLSSVKIIGTFFTATKNTILTIGLLPVYTFLMLFYRNKFREFISMIVRPSHEENVEKIAEQAAHIVPKYLKGLFIVCVILFGLNTLGFYIMGIHFAIVLGLFAAFFGLIPYIGNIIGYILVALFVFVIQGPAHALGVIVQLFIIQFIENNILTPNITGSYVEINPLIIIFSLIAGGMIWGLPGLFMTIPYLAILKIVCDNIPSLQPVGFLLSTRGTEKHTITIESLKKRFGWKENDKKDTKSSRKTQSEQEEHPEQKVH